MKAEAGADQVLTNLTMTIADVQSDIVEKFVLSEGANLGRPVIIRTGNDLPC